MDGRRRHAEYAAPPRHHEGVAEVRDGDRGRRLPDPRSFAQAGERPEHHVPRRPEAVPRLVRHRRADRRRRPVGAAERERTRRTELTERTGTEDTEETETEGTEG